MSTKIISIILILLSAGLLALSLKGNRGNPISYQNGYSTQVGGPFESSNSTARYALVEAIVKNKTVLLTEKQARFASPDVTEKDGKFFSIFTPGVSFLAVPFYMLGQLVGLPQLGAYLSVAIFSLFNFFLISVLCRKLGASFWAGNLGGFIFLFATNALGYSQTLTQHHMGVTVILLGLLNAMRKRTLINNIAFGALAGVGLMIDVPIFMLMIPIGLYILAKHFSVEEAKQKYKILVKLSLIGLVLGIIPLFALFGAYNHQTTGSYTTLAQTVGRTDAFKIVSEAEKKNAEKNKGSKISEKGGIALPFDTREQLRGFYILMMSSERSWAYYSPVVFLGIFGIYFGLKRKSTQTMTSLVLSIILLNIVLYTMFGDPWGGWSFGPRYLIPGAALLSIFSALLINRYRYNYALVAIAMVLLGYSVAVNSIGVLTTNAIPPKVEAIALSKPIPFTPEYNLDIIKSNQSSSLIYNLYLAANIDSKTYSFFYASLLYIFGVILLTATIFGKEKSK